MSESPTTIVVCDDLMFASRIGAEARAADAPTRFVRDDAKLDTVLSETDSCALALVDMGAGGIDPAGAITRLRSAFTDARIVAFFSHVDTDAKQRAQDAGAETMPRSVFVQKLPELLRAVVETG